MDIETYLPYIITEKKANMQQLSMLIGKEPGFVRKTIRRKHVSLPLLYALTVHLKTNLFEPFLNLLPEPLRVTGREATLQAEIASLQNQLDDMTKERDIYKEVAVRK